MHRQTDELVARGYDAVADAYAELEGEPEWPRLRRLRGLLRRLQPGARVLDLGCGSGVPARQAIVEAGHAAVGVDVSPRAGRAGTAERTGGGGHPRESAGRRLRAGLAASASG